MQFFLTHGRPAALLLVLLLTPAITASAQQATVNGFVTDRSRGEAIELANVTLRQDGVFRGAVTDRDGLYVISRIPPGRYVMQVSFVGYETVVDTLDLRAGDRLTRNVALVPQEMVGEEVVVQADRTDGAARVTAGQQTIRPADIALVPTPDVSGDLASYLTTLPGIVSTGDRGGQLFIRGGEPSQNLVQLDGMTVYQPFHILGFYSAFPSDILSRTDVYAGGFGARFGEGISSVIDVWTRDGNKRRFAGSASLSPFISALRLEGPVIPGRVSFIASARQSMIEQGAQQYLDHRMPFTFGDAFAKLHAELTPTSRLSLTGLQTYDRGTLVEGDAQTADDELRWSNQAVGLRYLMLPRILPISADLRLSHSRLTSEMGTRDEPSRTSTIEATRLTLDASFFGPRVDVEGGIALQFVNAVSELGGQFQNTDLKGIGVDHLAFYVEPEYKLGGGLRIRPGVRLQFYHIRVDPYIQPRLRVVWEGGRHQISGAAGYYQQEIIGLNDRRDAASVFTAWTNVPKNDPRQTDILAGRIPTAIHAILGYRVTPSPWLELSVESFGKWLDNLFIGEWTSFPRFTTRLQPAEGRAFGFDVRAEMRRAPFYGYLNYGLSSTRYEAQQASLKLWYGDETLNFRPPHDRRHQVNALLSAQLRRFDVSVRWEFGSGLPFSRAVGFDGFVLVDDIINAAQAPASRRVIYERPFNGLLPTYHRLDVSVERSFFVSGAEITALASLINVYDRRNLFYLDVFTLQRVDQLPLVPSLGLKVSFN